MSNILDHFVKVESFGGSQEEFAKLAELCRTDEHPMMLPSDVIWKNNEPVGYFSVQMTPMISAFFAKKMLPRDSITAINVIEQVVKRTTGSKNLIVPVNQTSPFYASMFNLGYRRDESLTYFLKNLCVAQ